MVEEKAKQKAVAENKQKIMKAKAVKKKRKTKFKINEDELGYKKRRGRREGLQLKGKKF